jgi:GT2 family glycosyltransferase
LVDIIIPSYNGAKELKICFNSLEKQTCKEFNVILVDNGSNDDSVKYTRRKFPKHKIIMLDKNYGFAKAINAGLKFSLAFNKSEYVLLLNNDIELKEDFLAKGIETFENIKEASFIAVKMLNYFKRDIIDDCGDFIKANGGSPFARGHAEKDTGQYDKPEFIFGACAGAAFYRKELFNKIGLFDEDYFAYLEDLDFSFRLQLAGYKCYYNPEIVCYHKRGETSKNKAGTINYYSEKNLIALRLKNYPLSIYLKYSPLFFAARVVRYYKFIKLHPPVIFRSAFKGYLKGLWEIPKSFRKRKKIQKSRSVSTKYIESLFGKEHE